MKGLKKILLAVATLPFMASCLDSPDSFSQSGFTNISCDFGFANTTKGYAGLYSLASGSRRAPFQAASPPYRTGPSS